jgi:ribose/xylose/arabinose/galactoside ABC-type transport system permease subunit
MIVVGIVLLLLTALLDLPPVLWTIGLILIIAGAVLWIFGSMGRTVGPRRHYW